MTSDFAGREHPPLGLLRGSSSEKVAGVGQEVGQSADWVMLLLPSALVFTNCLASDVALIVSPFSSQVWTSRRIQLGGTGRVGDNRYEDRV